MVQGRARRLGDGSHPVRLGGKAPVGVCGTKSPEGETKCEISVQFLTFPVRFKEYRSRAWTIYLANIQL